MAGNLAVLAAGDINTALTELERHIGDASPDDRRRVRGLLTHFGHRATVLARRLG